MRTKASFLLALSVAALLVAGTARAAIIDVTLGSQDFADGAIVGVPAFLAASLGELAPFDAFRGSDVDPGGSNFSESFSFGYAPLGPLEIIVSATIQFGILDHDSAHTGSQLASFFMETHDLTATLDLLFEASGEGANNQYDVYSLSLPAASFADLGDGLATFFLELQGPTPGFFGDSQFNGAGLDFARLVIETRSIVTTPEPSSLVLLFVGAAALSSRLRGRKRSRRRLR